MKLKNFVRALAIFAVVGAVVPFAAASSNPKCPKCHMVLSSKKDKGHTVAVKIKGKTYFCCAGCGMGKAAPTHKAPAHKSPAHKSPAHKGK